MSRLPRTIALVATSAAERGHGLTAPSPRLIKGAEVKILTCRLFASLALAALATAACTVYQPVPAYMPAPSSFDRSWNAALGAVEDAGVRVTSADRATGVITGTRDAFNVLVGVRTQADGSVRIEINATGPTAQDPVLAERISRAYDRRMGR